MRSLNIYLLVASLMAAYVNCANLPGDIGPAHKRALWIPGHIPRTLLEPALRQLQDISPLEKRDTLFARQACADTTAFLCQAVRPCCCPAGYSCDIRSNGDCGCCPVGQQCSDTPAGCPNPTWAQCPVGIGGCCPTIEACYTDANNNPLCRGESDSTSSPAAAPSTVHNPTTANNPPTTNNTATGNTLTSNLPAPTSLTRNGGSIVRVGTAGMGVGALIVLVALATAV